MKHRYKLADGFTFSKSTHIVAPLPTYSTVTSPLNPFASRNTSIHSTDLPALSQYSELVARMPVQLPAQRPIQAAARVVPTPRRYTALPAPAYDGKPVARPTIPVPPAEGTGVPPSVGLPAIGASPHQIAQGKRQKLMNPEPWMRFHPFLGFTYHPYCGTTADIFHCDITPKPLRVTQHIYTQY